MANTREPRNDAYTGLLAVSLVAMLAGGVLLAWDFSQYGETKAPSVSAPAAAHAGGR